MVQFTIAMTGSGITVSIAFFLVGIIWAYLSKKPLGMQTIYDRMIKDLILTSIPTNVTAWIINIRWVFNWNHFLAEIVLITSYWSSMSFFAQIINMYFIRYFFKHFSLL